MSIPKPSRLRYDFTLQYSISHSTNHFVDDLAEEFRLSENNEEITDQFLTFVF